MPVSPRTLLRLVRQLVLVEPPAPPRVLGVDDFVRPVPSKQARPLEDEGLNINKGVAMFR
jgi:hypothetical protein